MKRQWLKCCKGNSWQYSPSSRNLQTSSSDEGERDKKIVQEARVRMQSQDQGLQGNFLQTAMRHTLCVCPVLPSFQALSQTLWHVLPECPLCVICNLRNWRHKVNPCTQEQSSRVWIPAANWESQLEMVFLLMSSTVSEPNQLFSKWSFCWLIFRSSGFNAEKSAGALFSSCLWIDVPSRLEDGFSCYLLNKIEL